MTAPPGLLIVGNSGETHLGAHFCRAAQDLALPATLVDVSDAFDAGRWRRRVNWWLRGHRPGRLEAFNRTLQATIARCRPRVILATGIAPITRATLDRAREQGSVTINFLTDDPWNPAHAAPWFMESLIGFDHVLTPRAANLADLRALSARLAVSYLPFGYAPHAHFPESAPPSERGQFEADVMFAGGADDDRVAALTPFVRAGLRVALYGGYWDTHPETRAAARGHLDAAGLRKATREAGVCLCLVRRANRDGHAMRSFEVPAMGGCMLVEDTDDHRRLFGATESVVFFGDIDEAVVEARALVADAPRRRQLATAAHDLIVAGRHRYADRLQAILETVIHVAA
jgi:spore maturation protein CgeB